VVQDGDYDVRGFVQKTLAHDQATTAKLVRVLNALSALTMSGETVTFGCTNCHGAILHNMKTAKGAEVHGGNAMDMLLRWYDMVVGDASV